VGVEGGDDVLVAVGLNPAAVGAIVSVMCAWSATKRTSAPAESTRAA